MSTFAKYLKLINESNDTFSIKKIDLNSFFDEIETSMMRSPKENKTMIKTFSVNSKNFELINKILKNKKRIFLGSIKSKLEDFLNKSKTEVKKGFGVDNIKLEDISKGKYPNSFAVKISFTAEKSEKTDRAKKTRGVGEERGVVDKEQNIPYYKGAGPGSDRGGKPYKIFPKEKTKKLIKTSSYTDGVSFRNPGQATDKGGIYKTPFNHIPTERKKKK